MLPSLSPHAQDGSFDRRVASEKRLGGRQAWSVAVARLAVAGWLGALLVAAAPIPFGHAGAAGLALLLALPPVLLAVLVQRLAGRLLVPRRPWRALSGAFAGAAVQTQIIVAGAVLLFG